MKKLILIFSVFLIFGCSENRFKKNSDSHVFTFGIAGYDDYKFCNGINPAFINRYPSGKNPSRTCIRYQYYTCHINHYCPNLPSESERKKCEQDASDYWLKPWQDIKTKKFLDKVSATKEICNSEAAKNTQLQK